MTIYTIFEGVNGAGKTSIYKSTYYNQNKNEKRINTDEMVARVDLRVKKVDMEFHIRILKEDILSH